jgi:hypothetical protein
MLLAKQEIPQDLGEVTILRKASKKKRDMLSPKNLNHISFSLRFLSDIMRYWRFILRRETTADFQFRSRMRERNGFAKGGSSET